MNVRFEWKQERFDFSFEVLGKQSISKRSTVDNCKSLYGLIIMSIHQMNRAEQCAAFSF
ncbi:AAEL003830-PA [Aedes aegypti]|uniref:AAEL003830-PA n=1 Tax=Aedes aegypti TaxID=7159 RepID=Q17EC4_AEDAE|nr:AAEL003830-PA [Aedes aegypti]